MKPNPEPGRRSTPSQSKHPLQWGTYVPAELKRGYKRIYGGSQAQPHVSSTRMHRTANGTRHCNDISMSAPGECPAVSLIDATVVEELYGLELKRREQYLLIRLRDIPPVVGEGGGLDCGRGRCNREPGRSRL